MVRKVAVPYVEGLDFHAEFRRQESRYDEARTFDEKPRATRKELKRERREQENRAVKKSAPLPIPPAQVVKVGRPAKRAEL